MSLPTLVKTWQFNVNQAVVAGGSITATLQKLMRLIKNTLIGFGTQPWTVISSSDSVSAGAGDKWIADANLVWGNPTRSWIVLQQTGIAASFQLCIDLNAAGAGTASIIISPGAGFTGGATNARPTATDEKVLINAAAWGGSSGTNQNYQLHVMQSTDGKCTRVIICAAGIAAMGFWAFEVPVNPPAGWANPSASIALGNASNVGMATFTNISQTAAWWGRYSGTNYVMNATGEAWSGGAILPNGLLVNVDDVDGNWPIFPIGLASTTVGFRGRQGVLPDLYWGSSATNSADTYPNDATRQFATFGNIIVPWNGSVPLLA